MRTEFKSQNLSCKIIYNLRLSNVKDLETSNIIKSYY